MTEEKVEIVKANAATYGLNAGYEKPLFGLRKAVVRSSFYWSNEVRWDGQRWLIA